MLVLSRKHLAQGSAILSVSTASFALGWSAHGTTTVVATPKHASAVVPATAPVVDVVRPSKPSPVVLRVRAAARRAEAARKAKAAAARRARLAQPKPSRSHAPRVSISLYERSVGGAVLQAQGCRAGRRGVGGLTILDFGKPYASGHAYGTLLFSDRFASNAAITRALWHYAVAYVRCLPKGSQAKIVLARGTSNYHPAVRSAFKAGVLWALETQNLGRTLARHPWLAKHVTVAAADDAEPAWDRSFQRTYSFFRGFEDAGTHLLIYDFGSLDGGVGTIWSAKQAFFVAGGMRDSRVVPEIYNHAMAHEWATLAHITNVRYKRPVRFAGVMTQHHARFSMAPVDAHQALVRALAEHVGNDAPAVPQNLTNITAN